MAKFAGRGTVIGIAVTVAVCAVALGALVASILLTPFAPASTKAAASPSDLPITTQQYLDPQQVQLTFELGGARSLLAPASGMITSFTCLVGRSIESGSAPISIDGQPRLALATSVPMWRDLSAGAQGADVAALQAELSRLGHSVADDHGRLGSATRAALAAVMSKAGVELHAGATIHRDQLLWVPDPKAPIASCTGAVGSAVTAGQSLATLAPALVGAAIAKLPSTMVPGARALQIGTIKVSVDAEGRVTSRKDLDAIAASPDYASQSTNTSSTGLAASLTLDKPVTVAVVPPSAVVGDQQHACVVAQGHPVAVQVVGSQLGESYVTFTGTAPASVAVAPPKDTPCS